MSAKRLLLVVVLIIIGAMVVFLKFKASPEPVAEQPAAPKPVEVEHLSPTRHPQATPPPWQQVILPPPRREKPVVSRDPRLNHRDDGYNEHNAAIKVSSRLEVEQTVIQDLQVVDQLFQSYQWAFGRVPVGSENRELTLQLLGKNPMHLIFIPHSHSKVSVTGELLDRWGSPYYFHPISGQEIGIRSLGPDGKLWSGDDVVIDAQ